MPNAHGRTSRPSRTAAQPPRARASATLRLTLPASALGHPATLAGVKVYVTTWDYDGGYRALTPAGGAMVFGGGDGATG